MGAHVVEQRVGKPEYSFLLLLHVLFKVLPNLLYMLSWEQLLGFTYVQGFIIVVTLLSIDFWFTKNISGRLLAGLRYMTLLIDPTPQCSSILQNLLDMGLAIVS